MANMAKFLIYSWGVIKTLMNFGKMINDVWIKYHIWQIEKQYQAKIIVLQEQIKKLENTEITDDERAEIARRIANLGLPQ